MFKRPKAKSNLEIADLDATLLGDHDPLYLLLHKVSGQDSRLMELIAIACYMFLIIIPGIFISISFQKDPSVLSLLDYRELPFALFVFLVVSPVVWVFYEWQLRRIVQTIQLLEKNEVLGKPIGKFAQLADFLSETAGVFRNPITLILPLLITLIGAAIWLASLNPSNPFFFGGLTPWWSLNTAYFLGLWLPFILVNLFFMISIIIRQVLAAGLFDRLFREFQLEPKLFHADGSNGLSPIGSYTLTFALLSVVFGFWVSAVIAFPMIYGQPINLKIDTIILFILYVLAVPSILFLSVWGTHRAMTEARERILNQLAVQIQGIMAQSDFVKIVSDKDLLEELQRRYKLLQSDLKTWPFQKPAIASFGLTAISPLISTGVSYLFDKFILRKS